MDKLSDMVCGDFNLLMLTWPNFPGHSQLPSNSFDSSLLLCTFMNTSVPYLQPHQ